MAHPVIVTDLTELVDGTGDPAFAVDAGHVIVAWNRAAEDLLGYSAREVLGRNCAQVIGGRDGDGHIVCNALCPLQRALRQGERIREMRIQVRRRDGAPVWVAMTSLVLTGAETVVHILRDITTERTREAFLRQILEGASALVDTAPPSRPDPSPALLSPRETEILRLLASGYGTRAIAQTLAISPATVRNHIQQIMMTLRVHSRLEAVVKALQRGLI